MAAGEAFSKFVILDDDTPDAGDLFDVGDCLKRSILSIIEDDTEVPIRKEQMIAKSVGQFLDYLGLDPTVRYYDGKLSLANFEKLYGGPMSTDIIEIAKAAARGDTTTGLAGIITGAEYLGEINKRAAAIRKPGESHEQAVARFTRDAHHGGQYPDGPILLKAATRHASDVNPK